MKKILALVLSILCVSSFAACNFTQTQVPSSSTTQQAASEIEKLSLSTLLLLELKDIYISGKQDQSFVIVDPAEHSGTPAKTFDYVKTDVEYQLVQKEEDTSPSLATQYPHLSIPDHSITTYEKSYAHLAYKKNDEGQFTFKSAIVGEMKDGKKVHSLYVEVAIKDDYCYMEADEVLFLRLSFDVKDGEIPNYVMQGAYLSELLDNLFKNLKINPNAVKNSCKL